MTQRCMISAACTGTLETWWDDLQQQRPHLPGNRAGDPSILSVVVPPSDVLSAEDVEPVVYLPSDPVIDPETGALDSEATVAGLLMTAGPVLAAGGNFVLIGTASQWRQLHATPHWRAWTGNYGPEGADQRAADHAAIGLPGGTTDADARDAIVALFLGAS